MGGLGIGGLGLAAQAQPAKRPNILLILADDLGFSDLGCFGGEIETPHLDRLAANGTRFTQLYNNARCCPSRAALLTGQHPHRVGMGNMVGGQARPGFPGFAGRVSESAKFLPAVLRESGYTTLMCGKWHLGAPGPVARGFDEFYGMVHGYDSFWDPTKYTRLPVATPGGRPARPTPANFYATDSITDHALDFLATARQTAGKPWFLYLAYNAPHFPLHAPKELIDKYQPVYEQGWDRIREQRFDRLQKLGLLDPRWKMSPRSVVGPNRVSTPNGWAEKQNPAWESIPVGRRTDLARRMAIFAAMVDRMDRNLGRVIDDLTAKGELDNTLVLFCSDNGACAEWDPWGFDVTSGPDNVLHTGDELKEMGQPGTYHSYGSGWANTGNTPWRLYKHYAHEGGISSPFIAHWPEGIRRRNAIESQPGNILDLMPTCVELAGAVYPASMPPMEGRSLVRALSGGRMDRGPMFWEHEGNRAVRVGKWKAVAVQPTGRWELYDIEADRTELHDLAAQHPERVRDMVAQWEQWARRTNAIPWIWNPQYDSGQ